MSNPIPQAAIDAAAEAKSRTYVGYELPKGITLIDCDKCATRHPSTRRHCIRCGAPSRFLPPEEGACLACKKEHAAQVAEGNQK